mgnify:CR=1 FL=1
MTSALDITGYEVRSQATDDQSWNIPIEFLCTCPPQSRPVCMNPAITIAINHQTYTVSGRSVTATVPYQVSNSLRSSDAQADCIQIDIYFLFRVELVYGAHGAMHDATLSHSVSKVTKEHNLACLIAIDTAMIRGYRLRFLQAGQGQYWARIRLSLCRDLLDQHRYRVARRQLAVAPFSEQYQMHVFH